MYAPYGPFFAIMPEMLPANVAGEVIALVNSCGALGGFAGTWLVGAMQALTGSARAGLLFDGCCADAVRRDHANLCGRRELGSNRIARELAVDEPHDPERIPVLQLVRQRRLREILVADGADEAIDRVRADRSGAAVAGGRVRAAVHHRVADFDTGGKAIDDEPARFALENGDEIGKRGQDRPPCRAALR